MLGKFGGVDFVNSTKEGLSCSVKRSQDVSRHEDIERFHEIAHDLAARRAKAAPSAFQVRPESQGVSDYDVEGPYQCPMTVLENQATMR